MKKTVAAAIVTYNRLALLKESLTAVLNQGDRLGHVIVVDNQSSDGTREYLDGLTDPRLVIYHAKDNLGGAGGFNQAVRIFAEQLDDDFVWLMDDDTIAQPGSLQHLVDYTDQHPDVSFVNSQVRWGALDGLPSWMNVTAPRGFTWSMDLQGDNPAVEVVNSTFVSVMFSRAMVMMVGLPQKEYFIWGDDMEYTNRLANVYRGYMVLKSVVVHKSKENTVPGDIVRERDQSRLWRYRYEFRNRVLTARRISKKELLKTIVRIYAYDLPRVTFKRHVTFRLKKMGMVFAGGFRGWFFRPKIEYPAGAKGQEKRSINVILHARKLANPTKMVTVDEEVDLIQHGRLTDFEGSNDKADRYIKKALADGFE
ncbi:glycosyltransferase family 2 protein [Lactobacillaceae bacterium L1_55_11]|nr:glycosyltransferase family 2 protein [Lactobacillaceae bacterium L1_55_11]